ncbi:hypothetical protein JHK86_031753 [Glycine max]|nr:hypothetical protein JHK86_031753 [Glycine max]
MEAINLLILDECLHAMKKHPYSPVMSEFYHTTPKENKPSVFGMTASPVNLKAASLCYLHEQIKQMEVEVEEAAKCSSRRSKWQFMGARDVGANEELRQGITFELDEEMVADDEDREWLQEIINNSKLSEGYLTLARDIEVMEPKSPEDIYKAMALLGDYIDKEDTSIRIGVIMGLGIAYAGSQNE